MAWQRRSTTVPGIGRFLVLPFDGISKDLADLHTKRDQVVSAIRDLKRQGNNHKKIAALQKILAETQGTSSVITNFYLHRKSSKRKARSDLCSRYPQRRQSSPHYHFDIDKEITENRIEYIGFRCPRCCVSVARWKQLVPLGKVTNAWLSHVTAFLLRSRRPVFITDWSR